MKIGSVFFVYRDKEHDGRDAKEVDHCINLNAIASANTNDDGEVEIFVGEGGCHRRIPAKDAGRFWSIINSAAE